MPDTNPPKISYTSRDFTKIRADLDALVQATRPDDYTDFFTANLGELLIDMLAYMGDLHSYGQDITAQEVFLPTMRRLESALRFAGSVGFIPRSSTAASVVVTAVDLPANVVSFGGIARAGSSITGANGLKYELIEDATIIPGSSSASFTLQEGASFTETFTPTQQPNQAFTVQRGIVEQDSWEVFVGNPNDPLNKWTQVINVLFETSDTNTYSVSFDGNGRLTVTFGNGAAGLIPRQTVTISYRTTSGSAGNSGVATIRGSLQVDVIGTGTTAAIRVSNPAQAATGGQDR